MDDLDRALLSLLRSDARAPTAALAKALKVSRGTVQNRIERLRTSGILLGFTVRLAGNQTGPRIRAIMTIAIEGMASGAVTRALRGVPPVTAIHTTNGRWDLVVELAAADLAEFSAALDQIRAIPGISGSETSLLLKSTEL